MEPVPRTLPENFRVIYEWLRRLDRRTQRVSRPPALMPGARLGPSVGQVEDLNDAVLTGWYQSPSPSNLNRPPANGSLEIQVVTLESGSVFQTARTHGSAGSPYGDEWVRDYRGPGPGWSDWRVVRKARTTRPASFLNGVTLGNGTATLHEWVSDGTVHQALTLQVGSTTAITGDISVDTGYTNIADGAALTAGVARYNRSGSVFQFAVIVVSNSTRIRVMKNPDASSQWVYQENANTISNWSNGSVLSAQWSFPIS